MKILIHPSNTEIPRQMIGKQQINIARTGNAQNTCIRDV